MRKPGVWFILLIGLGLTLAGPASATSLYLLNAQEMVDSSRSIVVGTVKSSEYAYKYGDHGIRTYTIVSVGESLKDGPVRDKEIMIEQLGGRHGEYITFVPGVPKLKEGDELVLFLQTNGKRQSVKLKDKSVNEPIHKVLGMSQGKLNVEKDPKTGKKIVQARGETFNSVMKKVRGLTQFKSKDLPGEAVFLEDFAKEIKRLALKSGKE